MIPLRNLKTRAYDIKERYAHWISPTALGVGFIIDNFTLTRIDKLGDNLILATHLLLSLSAIILTHLALREPGRFPRINKHAKFLFALMQFSFGGLFSGFVIFYTRSGAWLNAWPFLLLILGLMIGNEIYYRYYQQFQIRITIWFIALFSYLIFLIPVITGKIGFGIFMVSGALSVAITGGILHVVHGKKLLDNTTMRKIAVTVGGIWILFSTLYVTNIIPPVPLSLETIGAYHQVNRMSPGNYQLTYEKSSWLRLGKKTAKTINLDPGQSASIFAAVFSPGKLNTTIYHQWEYKEPSTGKWTDTDRIPIDIVGGRDDGYRHYSRKSSLREGKWRVSVTTKRGQVIGRITFKVKFGEEPRKLITENQ